MTEINGNSYKCCSGGTWWCHQRAPEHTVMMWRLSFIPNILFTHSHRLRPKPHIAVLTNIAVPSVSAVLLPWHSYIPERTVGLVPNTEAELFYLIGSWVWNVSGGRGGKGKHVTLVRYRQTGVFAEWELILSCEWVEIRATPLLTSASFLILRLSDSSCEKTAAWIRLLSSHTVERIRPV